MNGMKTFAVALGVAAVWSVFAAEWPEPPYTEEKIKKFVINGLIIGWMKKPDFVIH